MSSSIFFTFFRFSDKPRDAVFYVRTHAALEKPQNGIVKSDTLAQSSFMQAILLDC
jgi:hypothetical protein